MRTHLFNFITLRNPQVTDPQTRERFFVHLPADARQDTHFFRNLSSDTFSELKSIIGRRADSFASLLTLQQIKIQHAALLALYRAVKSEAFRASFAGLDLVVDELGPAPLSPGETARLWDNFAHYLWIDPQQHEIEAITAILLADKFLAEFRQVHVDGEALTEEQEKDLRRLSRGRVVLPIPIDNRVSRQDVTSLSSQQRSTLESAHDRLVAALELGTLDRARNDLVTHLELAISERTERARADRLEREVRLRERLDTLDLGEVRNRVLSVVENAESSSVTRPPIRLDDLRDRLSPETLGTLQREGGDEDVRAIIDRSDARIEDLEPRATEEIATSYEAAFVAFGTEIRYEEAIPPGSLIVKATPLNGNGYDYYLTYFRGTERSPLRRVTGTLSVDGSSVAVSAVPQPVQHASFQTFRLNDEPVEGAGAELALRLVNAEPTAAPLALDPFMVLDVVPHFEVSELGEPIDLTVQPPPLFGVNNLGVMDFRRVEQETACYVTGDVSHIENMLAREYKEKVSRRLSVLETEEEITQELTAERQSDTETAERLEMQTEASSVLSAEKSRSFDFGAGVSAEFPGGTLTTNLGLNFNSSSSREDSTSEALTFAKNITNRIQEKITQKTLSRRRSLHRQEFENINKHGFDNREGEEHVVGVYRWVDKIIDNHLVNYGRRCVIEFQIPEPARNFIRAQERAIVEESLDKKPPKSPRKLGLKRPHDIDRKNYVKFAKTYGVSVPEPPAATVDLARAFADSQVLGVEGQEGNLSAFSPGFNPAAAYNEIEVPEGYVARRARVAADFNDALHLMDDPLSGGGRLAVSVGDSDFENVAHPQDFELPGLSAIIPISVQSHGALPYVINVGVHCELDPRVFRAWRLETYNTIMEAYRNQLADYENALEEHESKQETVDLNPRFKKQLMERELKRLILEMLTKPHGVDLTANHYGSADGGLFRPLKLSANLDKHAATVKFFEQAFDWHLMAYIFYPYFYSAERTWAVKLGMEATKDQLFSAFLTSGMGRAEVPIRPGWEDVVTYYLQTGETWFGGGFVLDVENDLYLSIANELTELGDEEVTVERTWQSKLPTNLTIVQSQAAALIAEGLPCRIDDDRIGTGNSRLAPVLPAPKVP